jgi:hypothetical protein
MATRTAHVRLALTCAVTVSLAGACGDRTDSTTPGAPAIVLHDDPAGSGFGAVDVVNVPADVLDGLRTYRPDDPAWDQILTIRNPGASQPVIGRYEVIEHRIRFVPRFAPVPGQPWQVRFVPPGGGAAIDTVMRVMPATDAPPTRVVAVFPAVDTVPMNLLRAYVAFSAPMSEGEAYDRIRLLDASGEPVPDAFLILEHELWDAERTRFTLLFDPGRIKRGLVPNEEIGLPLRDGNDYTLVIDAAWADASGRQLAQGSSWSFHAGPPDRTSPRVDDWTVTAPSSSSREPVVIDAGEPLDQALFERLVAILDPSGRPAAGSVEVSAGGSRWTFVPEAQWTRGEYTIRIGTELEDLAGNNLRHLFDVDRSDRQDTGVSGDVVALPLRVR